jgi:hypothetical protein
MNDNVPPLIRAMAQLIREISFSVKRGLFHHRDFHPSVFEWRDYPIHPTFSRFLRATVRHMSHSSWFGFKSLFVKKQENSKEWEDFAKLWYLLEPPTAQSEVPPQIAVRMLSVFSNDKEEPDTEDHIAEEFEFLCESKGVDEARRWVWKQARASVRPFLLRTIRKAGLFRTIR